MTPSATAILTLLALLGLLVVIAVHGARRTHNVTEFAIANRRLGAWSAGLGYAGAAVNAWTLMIVAAAAFTWGLAAVWIWVAIVCGCIVNLWYVAPRMRALAVGHGHVSPVQLLTSDSGDRLQPLVARSAVFIVAVAVLLQLISMLQFVGGGIAAQLGADAPTSSLIVAGLVTAAVFAGGLRSASACDASQAVIVLVVACLLCVPALIAAGGWSQVQNGLAALGPASGDWLGGKRGVVAVAFVAGVLGIGFALLGQPQAHHRLMAVREDSLPKARWITISWIALLLAAVIVCGWCAGVLYAGLDRPQDALFAIATRLLPPWLAVVFVVLLLGAIALSAAGLLFVFALGCAVDLRRTGTPPSPGWARLALVLAALLAWVLSVYSPVARLDQALLGFSALGAALGPLLLVRLTGKRIRPGSTLGAMWASFVLSLLFHLLPDAPGDFMEHVLPFVASLGIALTGGERRRNPDRADRSQETMHDRVPI